MALAIVGSRATADLQLAIMTGDQAVLVSIPGIGQKLAERVIFELKEKVTAAGVAASGSGWLGVGSGATRARSSPRSRPWATRSVEARDASRAALADAKIGVTLEDRVKAALRSLAPRLTWRRLRSVHD
ncbi:MAG: helix-hairpin-helix domain-containing protein [Candidatus Limnocylindrales bacterium]